MSTSPAPRRRERRGADTRRRIEQAAAELFAHNGYTATSMQAIAAAAGVHVQTIYLAYGTKAAVLAACAARLVAGDEDPDTHPGERRWAREIQATADPRRKLELYVRHVADVAVRVTELIDVLRATAPAEPEAAAFLAHMEHGRREGPLHLLGPLAGSAAVRPELTSDDIADITFALASPDTLRALVTVRGWDRNRAQDWLTANLSRELLARPGNDAE
jgi:AcrR family transcriptional regulator